jgi:hypothetical protein
VDPLTEIEHSHTDKVKEVYKSWTGRWVLIGNNEIHTDCCALLGCFYTKIHEDQWISSSLAILQEIGSLSPRPETLKHEIGIEWYPLPTSRFEGVNKLLPSQVLNLNTFLPVQRALPGSVEGLTYVAIIDQVTERLRCLLLNVANSGKRVHIALTSGYDSRVLLAAARYAGVQVHTFTRIGQETAYSDVVLPGKLSKASGYHHQAIRKTKFSKEKEELFDYHTGGNVGHIIRKRFAHGQYDAFTNKDIILSGGIFEVSISPYINIKKMDAAMSIETIIKAMRLEYKTESYNVRALAEWVRWVQQTPTEGLDWRDRFYLEQRNAGWQSSIQQALDLTATESLHIINSHDLISLLLSIPDEKKQPKTLMLI